LGVFDSLAGDYRYTSDYASPTPVGLTTAISDMETAYTDAAGLYRQEGQTGGRNQASETLTPGVYTFDISIALDMTFSGTSTVFMFRLPEVFTQTANTQVILQGGARQELFWQVAGQVTVNGAS
jgi:hypothetical protein